MKNVCLHHVAPRQFHLKVCVTILETFRDVGWNPVLGMMFDSVLSRRIPGTKNAVTARTAEYTARPNGVVHTSHRPSDGDRLK